MNTFQVSNGDLVLSQGGFTTISGPDRIQQDLEVGCFTPYGSDRFHPRYGSIFSQMIGTPSDAATNMLLANELQRIVTNYQTVQVAKMNSHIIQGQSSPYNQNDVVASVSNIAVTNNYDSFTISATLTTLGGQTIPVTQVVSTNTSA